MKVSDYISLGYRNIWRRKSRSFLTIFAVVIGTISIVIMLSLVMGAKQIATQQLESIDGLTLVSVSASPELQSSGNLLSTDSSNNEGGQKLNDTTVNVVRQIPHVIDATPISGVWIKSIKLEGQDKKYRANLMAYTPGTKVLNFPISAGTSLKEDDMAKIVIGGELLRNFGYSNHPNDIIGKKVILYTQGYVDWGDLPPKPPENATDDYWNNMQNQPHEITAEIVGVVSTGVDESQNYITLAWGTRLMTGVFWKYDDSLKNEFEKNRSIIENQLREAQEKDKQRLYAQMVGVDDSNAKKYLFDQWNKEWEENISNQMRAAGITNNNMLAIQKDYSLNRSGYGSILARVDSTDNIESVGKEIKQLGLGAQTAKDMLDEIEKIFSLIGMIIGAIGGIVLFVAALGIVNNMIMATYERTREIGVLRACGATRGNIRNMFIFEAATLGFLGGVIGLIVSFGLAKILNMIGNSIAVSQGVPITNIISFHLWLIIGVIALTTLIGTVAGLIPAIHAARMDPVEALRYE